MISYLDMIYICILSGLLSSMYIWADKLSDIRISINDLYMIFLMTSWMIFFMAYIEKNYYILLLSLIAVIVIFILIRNQVIINKRQYYTGMIPHHSMAIMQSKKLLDNDNTLSESERNFVKNIIKRQENEIEWMKLNLRI